MATLSGAKYPENFLTKLIKNISEMPNNADKDG